ncbi:MAG: ribonuclease HIII [Planctomycetes bacterium]|nr:ribonuclease HIII [Planctomycetota bacterium]
MANETRVFAIDAAAARALETRLHAELPAHADWRTAPHARFQVKSDDVVLTCYTSGKLVVQGRNLDTFVERFLGTAADASQGKGTQAGDADLPLDVPLIGSDEAGKGDYFGPLVVAAVFATQTHAAELTKLGIRDSKVVSDDRARMLAGRIESLLDHEIVRLDPADYNARWNDARNVNVVLGELHARAIAALAARHDDAELAIVDRFGDERFVASPLRRVREAAPRLLQVPRAERNLAVAAASLVARAAFLDGIAACTDACGTELHKGAGDAVDEDARRVVAIGGEALLAQVAKLHFKNTSRVIRT